MKPFVASTSLLISTGDTTIAWDESSFEKIKAFIQAKMDRGYSFYIIEPRIGGVLPPKSTKVQNIEELPRVGSAKFDEDLLDLLNQNTVQIVKAKKATRIIKKVDTAEEAATNHTLAIRSPGGG